MGQLGECGLGSSAASLRHGSALGNAALRELVREGVQLAGLLDGLDAVRFRGAPRGWPRWRSARRTESRGMLRKEWEVESVTSDPWQANPTLPAPGGAPPASGGWGGGTPEGGGL